MRIALEGQSNKRTNNGSHLAEKRKWDREREKGERVIFEMDRHELQTPSWCSSPTNRKKATESS
jgi:hypothetical protein